MLTVYPSNRLEDLAYLLQAVLTTRQGNILQPDCILVESQGMQHWLNLQLAKAQGIAMNLQFPMPSRFIWELARTLLGADNVPQQSSYRREVLAWRIDALLACEEFMQSDCGQEACHYWQAGSEQADPLKRYQLASEVADLFEQYMLYRPDWLLGWEQSDTFLADSATEAWQAWLWRALVKEQPMNPVILQRQAIEAMAENTHQLPEQIMIFAINTLAPSALHFFEALSEFCQVHLFHLNPCVQFWGELSSDKARARQIREQQVSGWSMAAEPANPLLANLGQQGKEFFNALQQTQSFEISAFDDVSGAQDKNADSVLARIQQDILQLRDAREDAEGKRSHDDSIVLTSSHSALREIQSLHDYLLRCFDTDPSLLPQDVLVMCPAIEDYAPYINAVFRRPWDALQAGENTRLPCSIADRSLRDAEPLIKVFSDLLQLPDSRFEVSKILDYLRLPALQARFGFSGEDLDSIEWWLQEAAVHWGLDASHKQRWLESDSSSPVHSWQWGLERLLLGYAYQDAEVVFDNRLLLPHVEGQQGLLLGRLLQLLERLQSYASGLLCEKTPEQWQQYLLALRADFFKCQDDERDAYDIIGQVIGGLAEYCQQAAYTGKLSLKVIRHYLLHHFTQPDTGNHFLTGQITFCSMVPMRSIPFKIIAVLGLNDGDFPRQNVPLSFDLMGNQARRQGDRSRRGDDRYLFLEALISARQSLYLSYQGKDVRNNAERQPSLILKELIDYLEQGYQWRLLDTAGNSNEEDADLLVQPLHPFSRDCFKSGRASYDQGWLRHLSASEERDNLIQLPAEEHLTDQLPVSELVNFFDNPLKQFAQRRLHLYLQPEQSLLQDTEPFDASPLLGFKLRDEMTQSLLTEGDEQTVTRRYSLTGYLPESPLTANYLDDCQDAAMLLSQSLQQFGSCQLQQIALPIGDFILSSKLNWLQGQSKLLVTRPARRKAKDEIRMWLNHLLATVSQQQGIVTEGVFLAFNKRSQQWQTSHCLLQPVEPQQAMVHLHALLQYWQQGLQQPKLWHSQLGQALVKENKELAKQNNAIDPDQPLLLTELLDDRANQFARVWQQTIRGNDYQPGLLDNPYFSWFYPSPPEPNEEAMIELLKLYSPLYALLQEVE